MPTNPGVGTPAPAIPPKKVQSEPPVSDSAWETADTVTSMPDTPRVATFVETGGRRPTPPPPAVATRAPSVHPPAASTSPTAGMLGLTPQMREEVWAIVRAAVAEATQPLIAKQRELEARAERTANATPVKLGSSPPVSKQRPVQLSVPPGVYGVGVVDPGPKKPDLDLSSVGPIDVPDFGGRGRMMPKVIAVVILFVVIGVLTMTILSHT
jgi:hypothetical protein